MTSFNPPYTKKKHMETPQQCTLGRHTNSQSTTRNEQDMTSRHENEGLTSSRPLRRVISHHIILSLNALCPCTLVPAPLQKHH